MISKKIQHDAFFPVFLFLALLVATVVPCTALELSETDSGRDFTVSQDEEISVRLPGNPTTGYLWEVVPGEPTLLKQKEDTVFISDAYLTGAGGHIKILFAPCGTGSTRLKLVYRRPWEKETPPIQTFEAGVTVTQDKK